jgi:hypothetical protein
MMKKFLVCVFVILCSISTVFAGFLSFGFGVNALNEIYAGSEETDPLSDIETYRFGAETRLRLLFIEASVSALYGADLVNEIAYIDGCATVGLSMNFLNLIKLGLGVGPYFGAKEQDNGWVMLYGDPENQSIATDVQQVFEYSTLHYRAHADMRLGNLSVGLTYQVPTDGYTITSDEFLSTLRLLPVWEKAKYGASVMFWLF